MLLVAVRCKVNVFNLILIFVAYRFRTLLLSYLSLISMTYFRTPISSIVPGV